ncbi:hypothetical protein [Botrimarina hoheduenensis]|uniref:Transmembrane protein n=1 Tax=Botrimarina hoheduenensis TaxID=2528000 RepID=A0A5C5W994_9BACT|nr:hypothetical protein [Botrimarina hoheduenensis]TWT46765.1 hypothetical protein Pla111_18660 [Botrimarina hoheduenensis]
MMSFGVLLVGLFVAAMMFFGLLAGLAILIKHVNGKTLTFAALSFLLIAGASLWVVSSVPTSEQQSASVDEYVATHLPLSPPLVPSPPQIEFAASDSDAVTKEPSRPTQPVGTAAKPEAEITDYKAEQVVEVAAPPKSVVSATSDMWSRTAVLESDPFPTEEEARDSVRAKARDWLTVYLLSKFTNDFAAAAHVADVALTGEALQHCVEEKIEQRDTSVGEVTLVAWNIELDAAAQDDLRERLAKVTESRTRRNAVRGLGVMGATALAVLSMFYLVLSGGSSKT